MSAFMGVSLAVSASFLLAGCGLSPQYRAAQNDSLNRLETTRPVCSAKESCERMWAAAASWVSQNCGYKIKTQTDLLIETHGPLKHETALACRVTKEPVLGKATSYKLVAATGCSNIFSCVNSHIDPVLQFNSYVNSMAP